MTGSPANTIRRKEALLCIYRFILECYRSSSLQGKGKTECRVLELLSKMDITIKGRLDILALATDAARTQQQDISPLCHLIKVSPERTSGPHGITPTSQAASYRLWSWSLVTLPSHFPLPVRTMHSIGACVTSQLLLIIVPFYRCWKPRLRNQWLAQCQSARVRPAEHSFCGSFHSPSAMASDGHILQRPLLTSTSHSWLCRWEGKLSHTALWVCHLGVFIFSWGWSLATPWKWGASDDKEWKLGKELKARLMEAQIFHCWNIRTSPKVFIAKCSPSCEGNRINLLHPGADRLAVTWKAGWDWNAKGREGKITRVESQDKEDSKPGGELYTHSERGCHRSGTGLVQHWHLLFLCVACLNWQGRGTVTCLCQRERLLLAGECKILRLANSFLESLVCSVSSRERDSSKWHPVIL
jgi:hypothetical protein